MTSRYDPDILIANWINKAYRAIASADRELDHEELAFAVNRLYYACFYALTAVLTRDRKHFGNKHTSLRSALHKHYVRTGLMPKKFGVLYDQLFFERQEGDYEPWNKFEITAINSRFGLVQQFIAWCDDYVRQAQDSPSNPK